LFTGKNAGYQDLIKIAKAPLSEGGAGFQDEAMTTQNKADNSKQPEDQVGGNGVTRRSFLQVFSALGLTAALPPGVINAAATKISSTLTEWLDKEWPSSKRFPGKTLAIEIPSHTNAGAIQAFFQARPWQYGGNPLDVSFTVKWPPPARLSPSDLENGGIDLNPAQMSMQVKKEGQDSKFDFNGIDTDAAQALTARGAVTGVTVTIRAMTPVTNLPEILGLNK